MLIDSRHYMTFDQRYVGLNLNFQEFGKGRPNAQCRYLLAHDFFKRNFTLLLEPAVSINSLSNYNQIINKFSWQFPD